MVELATAPPSPRRRGVSADGGVAGWSGLRTGDNADDVSCRADPWSPRERGQHHCADRDRRDTENQVQTSAGQSDPSYKITVNAGSGFIIDPSGLIATNWHVVTDAFDIVVTFSDGTRLPAKVVGAARVVDLALLKVNAGHPLQAVHLGRISSTVQIGDPVLAMGNALGVGLSVSGYRQRAQPRHWRLAG